MLDDPTVSPGQADAHAGAFALDDPRRAAGLTRWLAARAALDGSTVMPAVTLASALRAYGIDDPVHGVELAVEADRIVALTEEQAVALPDVAHAEEAVAEEALRLQGDEQLTLVAGEPTEVDPGTAVVADAHRLPVDDMARRLAAVGPGQRLVLCGDPDALQPAGPGRPFTDLLASGLFPVSVSPAGDPASVLGQVLAAVRRGELPSVLEGQREVVVVPCDDARQVTTRVTQLVTASIPGLLGDATTLVVTVREEGAAGVAALRSASDVEVATAHQAAGRRCAAVVVVLPAEAAGSLTRALLVSALSVAERHVSIVHQAGAALAHAVATRPHRPRATRLPGLLREMSA